MKKIIISFFLLLFTTSLNSQTSHLGNPLSWKGKISLQNIPAKIIVKLKIDPMLNRLKKYPICPSGSLNCSAKILNTPYKIINKLEHVPILISFLKIAVIKIKKSTRPSNKAS